MVSVGATTPRGGTSTRGKNPPQGGQHTGHAPTTGGHTTPRGARRGAPHRGGHQHTRGSLPPANRAQGPRPRSLLSTHELSGGGGDDNELMSSFIARCRWGQLGIYAHSKHGLCAVAVAASRHSDFTLATMCRPNLRT